MSKQYNFVPDLKKKLTEYNEVDAEIKQLEEKKEFIRDQIEKWMDLHSETLYEDIDGKDQLWKISKGIGTSNKIKDYELLKAVLPQEHRHLIVESTYEKFGLRRIDKHSKEWLLANT